MTEQQPTTGATPEQIEAAVERSIGPSSTPLVEQNNRAVVNVIAAYLVPPDHRIVPATRVLDDADVAAMRLLVDRLGSPSMNWVPDIEAAFARLDRILAADAARTEGQG